jgi:uncharacterized OB-fold protein
MSTITAYQCKKCGLVMYPHHFRCLECHGRDFEQIEPSREGTLRTFTVLEQLPWGIDERERTLGVVEFENGVKALGLIRTAKPKIGMRLTRCWEPVREIGGEEIYGLIFEPAK